MKHKTLDLFLANISYIGKKLWAATTDLLPIVVVVSFFQFIIIRKPLPNLSDILMGTTLVVVGLSLFIEGLERALFPLGEGMAYALSKKGSLAWLLLFSFALGFSTTAAEPALIAISSEAADIAVSGGFIKIVQSQKTPMASGYD